MFCTHPISYYLHNCPLHCTPLGPITITNSILNKIFFSLELDCKIWWTKKPSRNQKAVFQYFNMLNEYHKLVLYRALSLFVNKLMLILLNKTLLVDIQIYLQSWYYYKSLKKMGALHTCTHKEYRKCNSWQIDLMYTAWCTKLYLVWLEMIYITNKRTYNSACCMKPHLVYVAGWHNGLHGHGPAQVGWCWSRDHQAW